MDTTPTDALLANLDASIKRDELEERRAIDRYDARLDSWLASANARLDSWLASANARQTTQPVASPSRGALEAAEYARSLVARKAEPQVIYETQQDQTQLVRRQNPVLLQGR